MVESPKNTMKYVAPKPMNAPASIADTKHFATPIFDFVTLMPSAFARVSAGESSSGFNVFTSVWSMLMCHLLR